MTRLTLVAALVLCACGHKPYAKVSCYVVSLGAGDNFSIVTPMHDGPCKIWERKGMGVPIPACPNLEICQVKTLKLEAVPEVQ